MEKQLRLASPVSQMRLEAVASPPYDLGYWRDVKNKNKNIRGKQGDSMGMLVLGSSIRESPPQLENRIMARVYLPVVLCTKKLHFVSRNWPIEN